VNQIGNYYLALPDRTNELMNIRLLIILLLFSGMASGQNIIDNPGFDSGFNFWNVILTVDYYSNPTTCQEGNVFPASGSGCVGVRIYHHTNWADEKNWQEYILQSVYNEMHQDTIYKVNLKYRLADRCTTSTDALGIGFLNINSADFGTTVRWHIQSREADIKNPTGQWITNTTQYKELSGYYKAKGDEQYIAIGAFKMDHQMTRVPNGVLSSYPIPEILYFFDDVSVIPCINYPLEPFPEDELYSCDSGLVHLDVTTDNATYSWSDGSTGPTMDAPANGQTVWVEITRNGCVRRDGLKLKRFSGDFELGEDRKICSSAEFPVVLQVNANPGEQVLWSTNQTGSTFDIIQSGTYWAEKSLGNCVARDTITITELSGSALIYPNPVIDHFSMTHADHANILNIRTEDGKWIFKGVASMESMEEFVGKLAPAVYFLTTEIEGCILEERIVKMNE
jgi:hypothetical protein